MPKERTEKKKKKINPRKKKKKKHKKKTNDNYKTPLVSCDLCGYIIGKVM